MLAFLFSLNAGYLQSAAVSPLLFDARLCSMNVIPCGFSKTVQYSSQTNGRSLRVFTVIRAITSPPNVTRVI